MAAAIAAREISSCASLLRLVGGLLEFGRPAAFIGGDSVKEERRKQKKKKKERERHAWEARYLVGGGLFLAAVGKPVVHLIMMKELRVIKMIRMLMLLAPFMRNLCLPSRRARRGDVRAGR